MHYLKTTSFRTMLLYMGFFSLSVLVVISAIYVQTSNVMRQELDMRVAVEAERMRLLYAARGADELRDEVLRSGDDPRASIYWLADNAGLKIAGNLDRIPSLTSSRSFEDNWVEFYFVDVGRQETIRGQFLDLSDDLSLFVGRDLAARDRLASSFIQSSFIALLLIVFLGCIGGIVVARNMQSRIGRINDAARGIMVGDFDQRIKVGTSDDEFDALARNLNSMLDRISELMNAMRDVSENIAHDLRTPLNRLGGRLDVINAQLTNNPSYRVTAETVDELRREVDNVLLTFSALLSLARIESGAAPLISEEVDIGQLISELSSLYEPLIEETGARISLSLPTDSLIIQASRPLLTQAFSNLIENACKYALTVHGCLNIRVWRDNAHVSLIIEDNGPGIREADFERVLRRFGRLDASRAKPGNGLGLPLVYAIILRHGGAMSLGKSKLGGLSVEMSLPVKALA